MTPETIALIRRQFAATRGMEAAFAAAFYARLFEIDPGLRPLFPHDLSDQGAKLMKTLSFAVAALDRPEALQPAVFALGQRHAAYGVTAEMAAPVGAALLDTLAVALGEGFTPEARDAWTSAYTALVGMMAEGLASAAIAAE
ncbi:globin domain-containing protein [Neotabrizicola shimadae]|uniref:Hemin receptor n=1 Tax=Neotabrizicola shimadae TaxID=2807096 RepID=A0A8G1EE03_9RHOB|nr:globin domain-containing protein [Neotabrizicola shimadae]QYZ70708.1 hemin receptor [Neotabrizicola shimadae]